MIQSTTPVATKLCTDCLQEKPLTDFRRRYRGRDQRHNQCRECFARYMRYLRAVRRGKLIRHFVAEAKAISSRDVLAAVCVDMARRPGGVRALCAEWVAHLHAAAEARPELANGKRRTANPVSPRTCHRRCGATRLDGHSAERKSARPVVAITRHVARQRSVERHRPALLFRARSTRDTTVWAGCVPIAVSPT